MKRKILQAIADAIVLVLEDTRGTSEFKFFYGLGATFNAYCCVYLNIYLD
jgi:hypothetical protein